MGGCQSSTAAFPVWHRKSSGSFAEVVHAQTLSNFDARSRYSVRPVTADFVLLPEEVLGEGISGAVTKATSRVTGHEYALKSLNKSGLSDDTLDSLREEVNNYLRIDHPNIARLLHVYEEESHVSMVMELCPGKELFEHVMERTRFTEPDAAHVARQMFLAVAYLHRHNIVHCDIKLENVLFDGETGNVKLIDFGFSKTWDKQRVLWRSQGTMSYAAPEVLEGRFTDKCDVWSLGVVCFMLLSGTPPFSMTNNDECRRRVSKGKFAFKEGPWRGVSDDAKNFISRLLVVNPELRASALEGLQDPWLLAAENEAYVSSSGNRTARIPMPPRSSEALLNDLRRYSTSSHISRAVCAMIAHHLDSEELEGVRTAFLKWDTDLTGTITRENFTQALVNCDLREGELGRLFDCVDTAGDGEIHFSELAAALLQSWIGLREENLREAFELFDVSRTGYITRADLAKVFGGAKSRFEDVDIDTLMYECSGSSSGSGIKFEQFVAHLQNGGKTHQRQRKPTSLRTLLWDAVKSRRGREDLYSEISTRASSRSSIGEQSLAAVVQTEAPDLARSDTQLSSRSGSRTIAI
eukprot:TRINITY_DN47078_c0_g1_i1.p1 TRINITY_DN47078_c0_g1~~TRINITY_DN47078_c0_g1_i1.p1  ORF type:complete len:580 (+),score=105.34 TRINITY_DN47078_c0_g1_i1:181-1920(+)